MILEHAWQYREKIARLAERGLPGAVEELARIDQEIEQMQSPDYLGPVPDWLVAYNLTLESVRIDALELSAGQVGPQ